MKKALLVGRLAGRLRELGLPSLDSYYAIVSDPAAADERKRMLDRICTERDAVLPRRPAVRVPRRARVPGARGRGPTAGHPRRVRAWSAACSTGEEPYSLAMSLLARFPPESGWQVDVTATDLSTKVLRAAQAALWPIEKADDIPARHRKAFMLRGTGSQAGKMKAGPEIRVRRVVRPAEPQRRHLPGARPVRLHLLPQRAHLLRPAVEDPRRDAAARSSGAGRLPLPRLRRDGHRPQRPAGQRRAQRLRPRRGRMRGRGPETRADEPATMPQARAAEHSTCWWWTTPRSCAR